MFRLCEVRENYLQKDHFEKIQKMIQQKYTKEQILLLDYSEEKYEEANKLLLCPV